MDVGFIGLGRMGAGMAANILKAGHRVTVYNRTRAKAEPLIARGATAASTVADACGGDVVVTMLANDLAVEDVVLCQDGVVDNLPTDALHISSSTISVGLSRRLAEKHAQAGQQYVAAPVFGRPDQAALGRVFVIAAGASRAIETARPVLDAIGQKAVLVSDAPESANLVKLTGNFLIASQIESLGEALALAVKGGIDRHRYLEIMNATLFASPIYKTYGGLIADEQFDHAEFAAELGHKDIRLTLAAAEDLRVPMPVASLLHDRFLTLLAHGGGQLDWSAIGGLSSQDAGIQTVRGGEAASNLQR